MDSNNNLKLFHGEQFQKKYSLVLELIFSEIFLAVQWLRLCASNAGYLGSILGWGNKISHAARHNQKFFFFFFFIVFSERRD